ncbi:MAG TPA: polysaccharide biosynthesis/export family protein, partial [Pseudolabrys sp.]|nr:polysaccharide biosynthesis/export family protein [Pseudolabrys sp.]
MTFDQVADVYGRSSFEIRAGDKSMFQIQKKLCLVLMLAGALAGCSATDGSLVDASLAAASYAGPSPVRGSDGAYMLGPGDRIRLKVYDDSNLTGEYEVNNGGYVSIPLVGQVRAAGSTTSQLEKTIADRMRGKIAQDPKINVEIAAYAPFYIFGEVKKAGVYPYQPGITVAGAIATAGGLT